MTNPLEPCRRRAIVAVQSQAQEAKEAAIAPPPKPKRKLQGKKLTLKDATNG